MLRMAMLAVSTSLGVQDSGLPGSGPSWTTADVAVIIEGVRITDEGRQSIVSQLVEDFSGQWVLQLEQYQQHLDKASGRHAPEYVAASAALGQAMAASRSAHAKLKQLRAELSKARPNRALQLHHEIQDASADADELMKEVRVAQNAVRTATIPRFEDMLSATEAFDAQLNLRRSQLERDIKLLLLVEEFSDWTRVTTTVDRRRRLRQATLQGEHLNLDTIVNRLNPPLTLEDRAQLEPTITTWHTDIDAALDARSPYDLVTDVQIAALLESGRGTEALDLAKARCAAARIVRDTTLEHLDTICRELDEATAARLKHDGLEAGFPTLYHESSFERALQRCIAQDDLPRDELIALDAEYRHWLNTARIDALERLLRSDGSSYLHAIASSAGIERNRVLEESRVYTGIVGQREVLQNFYQRFRMIVGKDAAAKAMRRR